MIMAILSYKHHYRIMPYQFRYSKFGSVFLLFPLPHLIINSLLLVLLTLLIVLAE
jgi:hypothetical protein